LQFPNIEGEFGTWENDANDWIPASKFAQATQNVGATPILTLEPFQPALFLDWKPGSKAFEATKAFAQGAGKWNKPLFIRFAHEMNGSWYPWSEWTDKNQNMVRDPDEAPALPRALPSGVSQYGLNVPPLRAQRGPCLVSQFGTSGRRKARCLPAFLPRR
jgi:hypothetical protein